MLRLLPRPGGVSAVASPLLELVRWKMDVPSIGGRWSQSTTAVPVRNPHTGETIAHVCQGWSG